MKSHILDDILNHGVGLFEAFEKLCSCPHWGSALDISETEGSLLQPGKWLAGRRVDVQIDMSIHERARNVIHVVCRLTQVLVRDELACDCSAGRIVFDRDPFCNGEPEVAHCGIRQVAP